MEFSTSYAFFALFFFLYSAVYKRSKGGGWTFAVRETKEWNKLSVDLKRSTSVKNFKRSFFKIILNNQILTQLFM